MTRRERISEAFSVVTDKFNSLYNTVTDLYQGGLESGYIYTRYIKNGVHTITRTSLGVVEEATNVTDIAIDWANRATLIY